MKLLLMLGTLSSVWLMTAPAAQAVCSWTNLSNGAVADADQVMGNFDCKAPLASPAFTGKVSVGTTNPISALSIEATASPGYQHGLYIGRASATVGMSLWYDNDADTNSYIDSRYDSSGAAMRFRMRVDGSPVTALTIKGTGNVGVGTANPIAALSLNATGSPGYQHGLYIGRDTATVGMSLWYDNDADTNSYIDSRYDSSGAAMKFRMRASGTPVTAVTIVGSGYVGIGTTSPSYTLHVNGSVAGTSAYVNLSDMRLKTNVHLIKGALALIQDIRGVRFDWRAPKERKIGENLNLPLRAPQIGFIAQDLRKVIPEAVSEANDKDRTLSVAESKLVPILVEALKEAHRDLKAVQAVNARQDAQLQRQAQELQSLRSAFERRTVNTADYRYPRTASR